MGTVLTVPGQMFGSGVELRQLRENENRAGVKADTDLFQPVVHCADAPEPADQLVAGSRSRVGVPAMPTPRDVSLKMKSPGSRGQG